VAAGTTLLPEEIGGSRNWDYRFCWLRDATFTLYALLVAEAEAWRGWLLRAIAGSPKDLQIMYGVASERRLVEYEVPWLPGYENLRRSGSETPRPGRFSLMSTAKFSMHCTSRARQDFMATPRVGRWSARSSSISKPYGISRMMGYGRSAADASILRIPKSWRGSPLTGQ